MRAIKHELHPRSRTDSTTADGRVGSRFFAGFWVGFRLRRVVSCTAVMISRKGLLSRLTSQQDIIFPAISTAT